MPAYLKNVLTSTAVKSSRCKFISPAVTRSCTLPTRHKSSSSSSKSPVPAHCGLSDHSAETDPVWDKEKYVIDLTHPAWDDESSHRFPVAEGITGRVMHFPGSRGDPFTLEFFHPDGTRMDAPGLLEVWDVFGAPTLVKPYFGDIPGYTTQLYAIFSER
ncbi:hypothetical protein BJ138DRAFT_1117763 [Hygrophoropsis aurantiaca]|uniref:Uncharacterized protein n=1 Tax=Hygrophoropsis aurantiaca TaxID=72124 RepID=A0ACB7ZZB5_9AGAM|nr:hypothetical protein BJ138DRAFT_1117763 [Hygrophoropsis aurantiaca]